MDSAFKSAPFAGYTTDELRDKLMGEANSLATRSRIRAEIARRKLVAAGDRSVMTAGERLRFARKEKGA